MESMYVLHKEHKKPSYLLTFFRKLQTVKYLSVFAILQLSRFSIGMSAYGCFCLPAL